MSLKTTSSDYEHITFPKSFLIRLMTNMVIFPAVKVNNLNDQDLLNKKVLTALINALMQTGVSVTDSLGNDVQHASTLITEIDACIKQGNQEAEAHERFQRGIK